MIEVAIIGGSGIGKLLKEPHYVRSPTPYGKSSDAVEIGYFENKKIAFLPRHGKNRLYPPHKINFKANLFLLKKLGAKKIISVTSVGSLKKELKPPALFVPNDFFCLWHIQTYFDKKIVHITPGLDEELRQIIISEAKKVAGNVYEGVYAQTLGPRLETKAEVRFLKNYADVVGMNMATEATLANELELRFANISSVDNYANGIVSEEPKFEKILFNARKNAETIKKILGGVIYSATEIVSGKISRKNPCCRV